MAVSVQKPVAIILGGTSDHIALIEIIKRCGYRTVLIDYYENPPAKASANEHIVASTLDEAVVLEIAKQRSASVVIAACIDQALLTMAYVCEQLNLPCHISYQTALELTNKTLMKQKFVAHNIPTTKYLETNNVASLDVEALDLKFPLVVKPANANSSKGIEKVTEPSALPAALEQAAQASRTGEVVVEEYFEGTELSVDVVIRNAQPEIVLVTQTLKNKDNSKNFTITQSLLTPPEDPTLEARVLKAVKQIVTAYQLTNGPLLVQLLHNGGQIKIVEFSARIGGGSKYALIKKLTNFDILEYFVDLLIGRPYERVPEVAYPYGTMLYLYAKQGVVADLEGFDEALQQGLVDEVFYYKTIGTTIEHSVSSTDRVAGLLVADNTQQSLNQRLNAALEQIKIVDEKGADIKLDSLNGFASE